MSYISTLNIIIQQLSIDKKRIFAIIPIELVIKLMKLSLRCEYALLALIQIARKPDSGTTSTEICNSLGIPSATSHELLDVLVDAKYLRCSKGNFRLAKTADKISAAEIIRLFDGALAPVEPVSEKGYESAPMEQEPKLTGLFVGLQEQIIDRLEKTALADLI
jgi:Rrf2 family transcriptional regulator, cysteine metabolism repressor